jgi:polar amino acid transport system substrate-binding protein
MPFILRTVLLCAAVTVAPAVAFGADDRKPLCFCAEPAALPRTGRAPDGTPQGLDVAVGRLIAKRLGRPAEFHWCANAACAGRCLRAGRCDVILGQPADEGAPRDVSWSVPYAGGHFGLVVPRAAADVRTLADLAGKRVGVAAGTVALSDKNHVLVGFKTPAEVLDGFRRAKLDAAFVDADFAAWHLHAHPHFGLRLVKDFVPRQHWNLAVAVRAKDARLLVEINRALAELAASGEIRKAYAALGVPHRAPFTNSARREPAINTWKRIQDRKELVVSMDPANLPYSAAKGDRPGFDVEIAQALARELGVTLRLAWLDVHLDTAIGKLLERECDLTLGAAVEPNAFDGDEELAGKVIYSRPYYGTGYLLVRRAGGPSVRSLAELKGEKSKRIGAEAGSVADYRLRQRGYFRRLYRNQLAVLKALDGGEIDFGYLWANVGWTLRTTPEFKLECVPNYAPEDRWDVAVAMRAGDDELKRHVDAALGRLIADGTAARALTRYATSYFPPSDDGVIRHGVRDRGLEPQLQRVQRSKHGYGGLERVRSAGTLVVGLDQNNLPFSAAHPEPAGLDYEIAQLLAGQLGVALKVYWSYSSHDSYPSKLATKNLCDVILGIAPDDRFGRRVLYTKPYYVARYQFVVPAATFDVSRNASGPVAVEPGVAVRGLRERETRTYPSLEAILEAVATKQVESGYVIGTRGPWLAERRRPGRLRFVDGPGHADRFPICAAVRKTEPDLRAAIDRAFDELAHSGRLAKVFARWHVPYVAPEEERGLSR